MTLMEPEAPANVLVIDDDRMSQMVLVRNLRQAGYTVEAAGDGREGLDRMRAQPFDLVILDFLMPGMDGYDVLREIVVDEKLRGVPVVVVSGVDDVTNAATLVEAGAADYLTKPIDSGLLRARASRCIDAKRMREREQRLYAEIQANYVRLRELERLRDSLTHMIVHDLRTPLTSMLASLKTVTQLGDAMPEERKARLLELALRGGDTLVEMINDLLDVHKLEEGGVILQRAPSDLSAVAHRARDQVAALADKAGVKLIVEVDGELAQPAIDAAKIERVLVNLVGNAVKATDGGGSVAVRCEPDDGAVRVIVSDTGAGIAPEHLSKIFEKFYRVEGAKGSRTSTGLGLTFCKMVVEAHGGTISASSTPGEGTSVTFTLPV
jgi:two-component system sensor histidine kinase/response regulator